MLEVGYLNPGFILLTVLSVLYFWWAVGKDLILLTGLVVWGFLHWALAAAGFYEDLGVLPPRLLYSLVVAFAVIVGLGWMKTGAAFRRRIDLEKLHYYHLVRIFVESIFLAGLYEYGLVAKHITFHGTNFDVWIGLSTPIVALLYWRWKRISKIILVGWNVLGIFVLLSVIVQAILSAPFPLQQLSFEQPTVAPLYFPFIWLPTIVAPLAIFAHVISIRILFDDSQ